MRIAFLYTELSDYIIACLRTLKKAAPDTDILVIHFPINSEAPFRLELDGIGEFICVDRFAEYDELRAKITAFLPDKIVCCGWVRKWYIRICAQFRHKAVCILAVDNHWQNSVKQHLLRIVSRMIFKPVFHKIWVPGTPQTIYAQKIGFARADIITGFYCCDLDNYVTLYRKFQLQKQQQFPHRFLCVARYIPAKNHQMMWNAFIRWKQRKNNDWELWCAGTGELFNQRVRHPAIRHLGFVQKNDWEKVIAETGVFILPSLSEPWAVAVHELAAAGFPMLLSSRVGAAHNFLTAENGMQFNPSSEEELENCFEAFSCLTDEQLNSMGAVSHELAQTITPNSWAATLLKVWRGSE